MKKVITLIAVAGMFTFISCGPSAEEIAEIEKTKQDSIAVVEAAAAEAAAAEATAAAAVEAERVAAEAAAAEAAAKAAEEEAAKTGGKKK